jgi:hypothetical protein
MPNTAVKWREKHLIMSPSESTEENIPSSWRIVVGYFNPFAQKLGSLGPSKTQLAAMTGLSAMLTPQMARAPDERIYWK